MADRLFLLPYETYTNPNYRPGVLLYRPKYRGEIDFDDFETVASAPDRKVQEGFVVIRFKAAKSPELEKRQAEYIAALLAKPDVEEIHDTSEPVQAGKLSRVDAITKGLTLARADTGAALLASIKGSVKERDAAEQLAAVERKR